MNAIAKPLGEIPPAVVDENGRMCGFVHSIETGAAVDGPGVRFVLFVSGCQFRCLYCHNPDTWKLHNGAPRPVDDVVAEIGKYARFLKFAGGLTISGGEPLMQAHFVREVFYRVKKEYGLHTALDTQGFLAAHLPDDWFDPVDLVLLDIKHIDPAKHEALTSKPLQPTLDFAERLVGMRKHMWIRYVLVPGWTDDWHDVERHADYVKSLSDRAPGCVERVEVLPFHKMGEPKWQELGLKYELADTPPPSTELTERVREQFRARGLFTC
ncbi:pyruvate formate-lyase-activating enzyme [Chitiniphilus shinanonensis]|uniref:Pyruvate formate-lyase-activating enzyme n=1 Tax=Chitiniphilus shinanonensis TaxID=553088 RepID=A0ABQ6BP93_9NEIS|nr:pyruvate formate-lyase-activating protein [Chitiniphilus shinanonensis]GLS03282.1 pyruvate formate-lyase-activating enzyme [Chitiniphilus shinanonensis]